MGKDKREWRKLVKKLRRSRIRKSKALEEIGKGSHKEGSASAASASAGQTAHESESEEDQLELAEQQRWHDLEEEAWQERERQSNILFKAKQEKADRLANALAAEKVSGVNHEHIF